MVVAEQRDCAVTQDVDTGDAWRALDTSGLGGKAVGWTDERVELLKKLWQDGLSASQIAKQLGGVTRNAVIGKVHRLGLSGRATPSKPQRTTFKAPRPARAAFSLPPASILRAIFPMPGSRFPAAAPHCPRRRST